MKKLQLLTLSILFVSTVFVSCKKDDDDPAPSNNNNAYAGNWEGTYSGDDSGTWTVVIGNQGEITGTLNSTNAPGMPFTIGGTISASGVFDAYALVLGDSVSFVGQAAGTNATGTWDNEAQAISGTWEGTKK